MDLHYAVSKRISKIIFQSKTNKILNNVSLYMHKIIFIIYIKTFVEHANVIKYRTKCLTFLQYHETITCMSS